MNREYYTVAEAAAILNKTPQAIYQSKTLSRYIEIIDGKKVILKSVIDENNQTESNFDNDLLSHYEKLLNTYETEIKQLREDNARKDKLIEELASNAAELNKRFSVLLQNEQFKDSLKTLENPLNDVVKDPLKSDITENAAKQKKKRFFGLF